MSLPLLFLLADADNDTVQVSFAEFVVPDVRRPIAERGRAGLFVYDVAGNPVSEDLGPLLNIFDYEIHRYGNRIGTWHVSIPVDDQVIYDVGFVHNIPLQTRIKRGWHISIVQEGSHPEGEEADDYLLYKGVVMDANFEIADEGIFLTLEGLFHEVDLAGLSTRKRLANSNLTARQIAATLTQGMQNPGLTWPASGGFQRITVSADRTSRYAALVDLAERSRMYLRESWHQDKLEMTSLDNLPSRGITFVNQEAVDPVAMQGAGAAGFGIIGGPIGIREQGSHIANRIIPIGSDTTDNPPASVGHVGGSGGQFVGDGANELTLQFASQAGVFPVKADQNPDGTLRWYLQDDDSISRYGLIERDYNRSDVRNKTDSYATRNRAATALYVATDGELLRSRAMITYITAPLANGSDIWLLPGDRVKVQYSGLALTPLGDLVWKEIDAFFLVMERVDASRGIGTRSVNFLLGAPEFREELPPNPDSGEETVQIDDLPPPDICPLTSGGGGITSYFGGQQSGQQAGGPQSSGPQPGGPQISGPQAHYSQSDPPATNSCGADLALTNDLMNSGECCPVAPGLVNEQNETEPAGGPTPPTPPPSPDGWPITPPEPPETIYWSVPQRITIQAHTATLFEGAAYIIRLLSLQDEDYSYITGNDVDVILLDQFTNLRNPGGHLFSISDYLVVATGPNPTMSAFNADTTDANFGAVVRITSGVHLTNPLVNSAFASDDNGGVIPPGGPTPFGSISINMVSPAGDPSELVIFLSECGLGGFPNSVLSVYDNVSVEAGKTVIYFSDAVGLDGGRGFWYASEDGNVVGGTGDGMGSNVEDYTATLGWGPTAAGSATNNPRIYGLIVRLRKRTS